MIEKKIVVGPFQCNCRILVCPSTGDAAVIDPGDEAKRILRALAETKLPDGRPIRVRALFHTHAHLDHVGGTRELAEGLETRPEIALHRDDEFIYKMLKKQGELFGIRYEDPLPVSRFLEHEEEIRIGELCFAVIHTPGHSPGSVCLRLREDSALGARETVFSGDTLFQGSVGRTDLWGADGDLMFRMIRERLLTLDGDTRVCPGHGGDSRVGEEKRANPFLV